ncbi:MAG: hypothetical protein JSU72_14685, partial [Deltaproteobacteria bacterium]
MGKLSFFKRFGPLTTALLFAGLMLNPSLLWALVGDTNTSFGLDGRFSTTAALRDNYDFAPFFGDHTTDAISQTLLRLIAA